MKKALLLATAALLSASAAWAQSSTTYYMPGEYVTSVDELTSGNYFLHAVRKNAPNINGYILGNATTNDDMQSFGMFGQFTEIPFEGTVNKNFVWTVTLNEADNTFTLYNLQQQKYFSIKGSRQGNGGNHPDRQVKNIYPTDGAEGSYEIAQYALETIPEAGRIDGDDVMRFYVRGMNVVGQVSNVNDVDHPYLYGADKNNAVQPVQYWSYSGAGALQVEFIKVVETTEAVYPITIHFPDFNGTPVASQTLNAHNGDDAEEVIRRVIDDMNMGDVVGMTITGQGSDLIIGENNTEFTVGGSWSSEFAPDRLYRICVQPAQEAAALRYTISTGEIMTRVDGTETLTKLIPERFWYFKEVEGKPGVYTLHTLYDPNPEDDVTLGVCFDPVAAGTQAVLSETPTEFIVEFEKDANNFATGDIFVKVNGTNLYLNDYGVTGKLALYNAADNGSHISLYPLTEDDFVVLATDDNAEAIATAKADPSPANLKDLIAEYNATNLKAALRRVRYISTSSGIGTKIGQFNNANNTFLKKVAIAEALDAQGDEADPDAVAAAIQDIAIETLMLNEPEPGKFYRFKSRGGSKKYMSSIVSSETRTMNSGETDEYERHFMSMTSLNNRSNTVFYWYKESDTKSMLVSFDEGLVVPTFNGNDWSPVLASNPGAATQVMFAHQGLGKGFVIHVADNHRHLHGAGTGTPADVVDCGTGNDDAYQWDIELVEWLPINMYGIDITSNEGWASIYTPVPLVANESRVVAHTGSFNGSVVAKTKISGNVPAHTPVLLDYQGAAENSDARPGVSYVYLKLDYNGVNPMSETVEAGNTHEAELKGGIFAIAKESDKRYFTLHTTSSNNFREYEGTNIKSSELDGSEQYIPGFKVHIATDDDTVASAPKDEEQNPIFEITNPVSTGICEVAAEGVKAVYDLQGRKLAAPAKGINIVNGRKVLVK